MIENYIERVLEEIEKNKKYPRLALRLKQEGIVELKVIINKSGEIIKFEIIHASNFVSLNQAALNLIRNMSRLPEIPREIEVDELSLNIPIDYKIKKR